MIIKSGFTALPLAVMGRHVENARLLWRQVMDLVPPSNSEQKVEDYR